MRDVHAVYFVAGFEGLAISEEFVTGRRFARLAGCYRRPGYQIRPLHV